MQHFTALAVFGHVAIGQNLRDILLGHDLPFQIQRRIQTVAARFGTRETGDHVIHTDVRHFLRRLQRGTHSAFGFLHGANLAKADPARPRGRSPDHAKTGLPRERPDLALFRDAARAVKPQHQAGDL